MYAEIPNGSFEVIQGLKCQIPPKGSIINPLTRKIEQINVYRRSTVTSYNFWERDKRWDDYFDKWDKWLHEEKIAQAKKPDYEHPELKKNHPKLKIRNRGELDEFISECWKYRLGGFWFSNNGVATYITGRHWYYLSVYYLDGQYPDFREIDREFFYFWEYCVHDPNSMGMVEVCKRRNGKSYRAGCIGLEWSSRLSQFNVGIQSKTDVDADKLFKKAVIAPFRKLPFFFMPQTDLPHSGKAPAKWLKFYSGKVSTDEDELESMIDYQASGAMAYDGQKLGYYIGDEVGKSTTVNVNDRWEVVRYCLKDHKGNTIGKAFNTTTVEEMESGGANFLKLWLGSDQYNLKDGVTATGLYRYFQPADRSSTPNKYGFPNVEEARTKILRERLAVEDNPRALSQRKRKEPLEEREAFQADADSCVFSNPISLNERYDELKYAKPQYKIGNFHWKDGIQDGEVEFIEAPNGRFKVMYEPPEEIRNLCVKRVDGFEPNNKELFCAGIDPYDHTFLTKESEKRMSMGAICIIKKASALFESPVENAPALLYLTRPDMPHMFYEDAIKCLKYYGCQALIENNKGNIFDHFNDRGYSAYAAWLPNKDKAGIANTARTKGGGINGSIAEMTDQFLTDHVQKVYFEELIEQFLEFTPMDTTKYDAVMAFGYALMLQKSALSKLQDRKNTKPIEEYISWFKKR